MGFLSDSTGMSALGAYNQLQKYTNQQNIYSTGMATIYNPLGLIQTEIKKTVSGFLNELRKEIDAWHGDILRK
jgi:hypothetical protein